MTIEMHAEVRRTFRAAMAGRTPVEIVDRHISHLFLGPGRVWRLRRAVCPPCADFSMPALWLACCLRELDPNRHTGPGYAAFCGGIGRAAAPRCDAGAKVVERQFRADLGRIDWTPLDAGLPVDDLAAVAGDLAAAGRDREPAA